MSETLDFIPNNNDNNISNLSEFFKKVSIILYGKEKRKKEKKSIW